MLQQITCARSSSASSAYSASLGSSSWTPVDTAEDTTMSDHTATVITTTGTETKCGVRHPQVPEKLRSELIPSAPRKRRSRRSRTREKRKSSVKGADKKKETETLRLRGRKWNATSRILKAAQKPARGTRSHHLTQFFELDKDGIITRHRNL